MTPCNLIPCDFHFLHSRLFSKWQRTSSLTWVSALPSFIPGCGVGVGGWHFEEGRWEGLASQHSGLVSPLFPMLLAPTDDVSVLLQEIITEARNLSNAEM